MKLDLLVSMAVAFLKSMGVTVTREQAQMIEALIPQIPVKLNQIVESVNAELTYNRACWRSTHERFDNIESTLEEIRAMLHPDNVPKELPAQTEVLGSAEFIGVLTPANGLRRCPKCGARNKLAFGSCHRCGNNFNVTGQIINGVPDGVVHGQNS
jgi:hypothetical protein